MSSASGKVSGSAASVSGSNGVRFVGFARAGAVALTMALAGAAIGSPAAPASVTSREEPLHPLPAPPAIDPRITVLGQALFADQRLSSHNLQSCASCHDLAANGATSQPMDQRATGHSEVRNTPTVFNAALNFRLNWTGDVRTLQDQADESMRISMGQDPAEAVKKLSEDPAMAAQFAAAFGHGPDRASLLDAIAAFEQTLLTPDSRFDRWLKGVPDALPPDAVAGYQLFKSIGCISCHQGVNVGGNLFQPSGVYGVLTDPARPILRVPSLRNIAVTAPYFHDGSVATLPEAVRKMAVAQLDHPVTDADVSAIVAFLDSLTGNFQGNQVSAPDDHH